MPMDNPGGPDVTPDERDRMAKLEQQVIDMRVDVTDIKEDVRKLVNTYNMGEGAWKAIMRIGAIVTASALALAWVIDHIPPHWLNRQ